MFFAERTLTLLLLTSPVQDMNNFILEHDGVPYDGNFCVSLLHPPTGRATDGDPNFLLWPPRSPNFTPIVIVFGGKKNTVYALAAVCNVKIR
jgi:hypothetical protein